jgi:hypothetical protein
MYWRLLPLVFLVSCAADQPRQGSEGEAGAGGYRIVSVQNLPLAFSTETMAGAPRTQLFSRQDVQGRIEESGSWTIRKKVSHSRLLCAVYESGIQLGRGAPGCSGVQWFSEVEYGTRQRHCNSSTLIHSGGGNMSDLGSELESATCVRVITRCAGSC